MRLWRKCKAIVRPWSQKDGALLEAIGSGAWTINGFRNRDIRRTLFAPTKDKLGQKREAARVSRLLALLRAHGIIQKVTGSHRYLLSPRGRQILTLSRLPAEQALISFSNSQHEQVLPAKQYSRE